MSMKILVIASVHIFPSRAHPNAGSFFARLMDRLAPLIGKIVVISPQPYVPHLMRLISRRIKFPPVDRRGRILVARPYYCPLPLKRKHANWLSYVTYRSSRKLAMRLHDKYQFDMVLGLYFPVNTYTAVRIAEDIGAPSVTFAIGSDINTSPLRSRKNMAVTQETIKRSSLVLTTSEALAAKAREYCPNARNVRTYYRGIDLGFLDRRTEPLEQIRQRSGIAPGNKCLITVGHIIRAKGIWEFFETFKILAGKYENLQGILVGGGQELEALRQSIADAGLSHKLSLTGALERVDVGQLLKAADLMLFPSHNEGLPNVVMEAMAAGLPVVATDVGGTSEIVKHERTGLLVPREDVPAMVEAVSRLLEDMPFAQAMAKAGREMIRQNFDVDKNVHILRDMLEQLVTNPVNAGPRTTAEKQIEL